MLVILAMLAGCGGKEGGGEGASGAAKDGKIVIVDKQADAAAHSGPAAEDFAKYRFTCCDDPNAASVVGAYVAVQEALAADDLAGAKQKGAALAAAAAAAGPALPAASQPHAAKLAEISGAWASDDIKGIRADLGELSTAAMALAKAHSGGEVTYIAAFCPMAPGRWLQSTEQLRNPYYGAEMLTCGVFEQL